VKKSDLAWGGGVIALAMALLVHPAQAQERPTWTVSKTPKECVLNRRVGGPVPSLLMVRSAPGSDSYTFVVGAAKLPAPRDDSKPIDLFLEGSGKEIKHFGMPGNIDAEMQAIQFIDIDWTEFNFVAKASAVSLKYDGKTFGPYALPDIADAVAALRDCLGEHLRNMGADPAQFAPGGAPPEPYKSREDFLSLDQLGQLIRAGAYGFDRIYTLNIGIDGRIAGCKRSTGSGGDRAEKALCGMLAGKALFAPAHDSAGKPVVGVATYWLPVIVRRVYTSNGR
jgi:hypothetical protein